MYGTRLRRSTSGISLEGRGRAYACQLSAENVSVTGACICMAQATCCRYLHKIPLEWLSRAPHICWIKPKISAVDLLCMVKSADAVATRQLRAMEILSTCLVDHMRPLVDMWTSCRCSPLLSGLLCRCSACSPCQPWLPDHYSE